MTSAFAEIDEGNERAARESYDAVAIAYARQFGPVAAADQEMGALFDEVVRRSRAVASADASAGVMGGVPSARPLVADVGCGPGWWTQRMALAGAGAVGVDLSAAMVGVAVGGHREDAGRFVVRSATDLPLATGAFDGVCLWYVLHHLDDAGVGQALAKARRLCRPGAVTFVGGHVVDGTRVKREGYGHPMEVLVAGCSPGWWENAVCDAGFDVGEYEVSDDAGHHVLWVTVF